ncbi:hypothetical protein AK812_SmicGene6614 [Symbiodinium microadriaticum]|uniref:Uncharacterized protein n=1 Tax=Symbiodinium microadriaticum TaxID=2951 RepID=A0A1Q9EQL4_SYMMI|nr:hypothetical protein AK812_SmicGene6614 [Symbiodinium microadriaticum]
MASASLRRNLEELLLTPAPSASFRGRRPRVLTSFEDDYESAYKKSQEQDEKAFDDAEGSLDSAAEESAQATEAAAKEVGKEQSGEEEAKKINDIGQTDSARCKDGCRLSNGIGKPIGPPPPEEGFGGAQGSGALGVEFPTGGPGQAPGTPGQGGQGGMDLGLTRSVEGVLACRAVEGAQDQEEDSEDQVLKLCS